jgi:hypothetical protein
VNCVAPACVSPKKKWPAVSASQTAVPPLQSLANAMGLYQPDDEHVPMLLG